MTRANARDFLAGVYAQQLTEAGLTAEDNAANLGPVIDEALLVLGTSYDDLATAEVASADVQGYRALLRYFGLSRVLDAVMNRVDVTLDGPQMSKRRSQYVEALQKRLDVLAKDATNYGLVIGPTWQAATTMNFDIFEPDEVTV
jgi:hypothetical protein